MLLDYEGRKTRVSQQKRSEKNDSEEEEEKNNTADERTIILHGFYDDAWKQLWEDYYLRAAASRRLSILFMS